MCDSTLFHIRRMPNISLEKYWIYDIALILVRYRYGRATSALPFSFHTKQLFKMTEKLKTVDISVKM